MNARQQRFCDGVIAGKSHTQAYADAGFTAKNPASGAEQLLRNTKVRDYINAGLAKLSAKIELTAEAVLNVHKEIAFNPNNPLKERRGSADSLMRHLGLNNDRLKVTHEMTEDEARQKVMQLLKLARERTKGQ